MGLKRFRWMLAFQLTPTMPRFHLIWHAKKMSIPLFIHCHCHNFMGLKRFRWMLAFQLTPAMPFVTSDGTHYLKVVGVSINSSNAIDYRMAHKEDEYTICNQREVSGLENCLDAQEHSAPAIMQHMAKSS
jgi:hypothetical protein